MARSNLTVDVEARLTVSDATAERCLRLLEIWMTDNDDKTIEAERLPDGRFEMRIRRFEKYDAPASD